MSDEKYKNFLWLHYVFKKKIMNEIFENNKFEMLDWDLKKKSTICFVEY